MESGIRMLMSVNKLFYQISGGRISSRMAGYSILLLHTTGWKTGTAYTVPLTYFRDGEDYILVASNWGRQHNPGWYHNLLHKPAASIQVKDQILPVHARIASGEERTRLWNMVAGEDNFYSRYQKKTRRQIPLVILTPVDR